MKKTLILIFISLVFSLNAIADDQSILCPCCSDSSFIASAYDYIVQELKETKKNEEVLRTEASDPDQRIHERDLNIAHYLYQDTKLHYLEAMRDLMSTDDCDECYQAIYLFYNLKLNEYQKGIEKMVRY